MTKEQDEKQLDSLEFSDTLTDLGCLIQKHGCAYVAKEFREYYPEYSKELGQALLSTYKPVAALLKKGA